MSKNEIWTAEMSEEYPYREKMGLDGVPWNAMKLIIANHLGCLFLWLSGVACREYGLLCALEKY